MAATLKYWWKFENNGDPEVGGVSISNFAGFSNLHVTNSTKSLNAGCYTSSPITPYTGVSPKFSISGWYYFSTAGTGSRSLFDKFSGSTGISVNLDTGSNTLYVYFYGSSYSQTHGVVIPTTIAKDIFHHIILVYDDSLTPNNVKIYLNGVEYIVPKLFGNMLTPDVHTALYLIGSDYVKVDDFRIYEDILTPSQISNLLIYGETLILDPEILTYSSNRSTVGSRIYLTGLYFTDQPVTLSGASGVYDMTDYIVSRTDTTMSFIVPNLPTSKRNPYRFYIGNYE